MVLAGRDLQDRARCCQRCALPIWWWSNQVLERGEGGGGERGITMMKVER